MAPARTTGTPSGGPSTRDGNVTHSTPVLRRYPYAEYSELTGPFQSPERHYRVRYVSLTRRATMRLRGMLLVGAALVFEVTFLGWLVWPSHYPVNTGSLAYYLSMAMVGSVGAIELMRLVNIV